MYPRIKGYKRVSNILSGIIAQQKLNFNIILLLLDKNILMIDIFIE